MADPLEPTRGSTRFWRTVAIAGLPPWKREYYVMFWKAVRSQRNVEIGEFTGTVECSTKFYFTLVEVVPCDSSGNTTDPGSLFLGSTDFYYKMPGNLLGHCSDFNSTSANKLANFSLASSPIYLGISKSTGVVTAVPPKTPVVIKNAGLITAYCFGASIESDPGANVGATFALKVVFDEALISCTKFNASPKMKYGPLVVEFDADFSINNTADVFSKEFPFLYEPKKRARGATATANKSRQKSQQTVKQGDTLSKIARFFGISLAKIKALNPGINHNQLSIGQKINIPQ